MVLMIGVHTLAFMLNVQLPGAAKQTGKFSMYINFVLRLRRNVIIDTF